MRSGSALMSSPLAGDLHRYVAGADDGSGGVEDPQRGRRPACCLPGAPSQAQHLLTWAPQPHTPMALSEVATHACSLKEPRTDAHCARSRGPAARGQLWRRSPASAWGCLSLCLVYAGRWNSAANSLGQLQPVTTAYVAARLGCLPDSVASTRCRTVANRGEIVGATEICS